MKSEKSKKTVKGILSSALVAGAVLTAGSTQAADLLSFDDLGSGSQLRADLLDASPTAFKSPEAKCGEATNEGAKSETKSAEHKCGEGKCGEEKSDEKSSSAAAPASSATSSETTKSAQPKPAGAAKTQETKGNNPK